MKNTIVIIFIFFAIGLNIFVLPKLYHNELEKYENINKVIEEKLDSLSSNFVSDVLTNQIDHLSISISIIQFYTDDQCSPIISLYFKRNIDSNEIKLIGNQIFAYLKIDKFFKNIISNEARFCITYFDNDDIVSLYYTYVEDIGWHIENRK